MFGGMTAGGLRRLLFLRGEGHGFRKAETLRRVLEL